ncbi:ribonuclease J [Mycoplasmoides fastidiosum]|uniref:Ribonuclease J n=1 Tax=Mycoplasmoides fastidiosum TaxID=92758 RepID=A0ABU0LZC9_9BACT|nr:ribonuclease J [Mycoplasmoides fastidiosum]MDQ0513945.1 ribonuclease J [Mycoplasmoides fastidiosum]UUD37641.1 ribonuclease J [Mycoplasmoides fastidiosum]
MANIKYFALGGQDERAKYSGVLEINDEIFILNTGIGDDITNQFGISKVIPDLHYLKKNKRRIKGIFLGTPEFLNIGALPFFLEALGHEIPVYTSKVGQTIIQNWFARKSRSESFSKKEPKIRVCSALKTFKAGQCEVVPFKIFNSMPDSLGWVFKTNDGAIVFIDQFIVENTKMPGYESQLLMLPQLTNFNVLALIVGLQNVGKNLGFAAPSYKNFSFLKKAIANSNNRMIVACYDNDLLTVLNVAEISKIYGLKLVIYSNTLSKLFDQLIKMRYISNEGLSLIDSKKIPKDNDVIILITGNQDRLYHKMHKILTGQDSNISFGDNDTFILNTITQSGLELREAKLLDEISRNDVRTKKIGRTIQLPIAGSEDHKFLLNLLNPKLVFPGIGYYKEFASYIKDCENTINPHKIRFLYNGEMTNLIDGKAQKTSQLQVGEQYVDFGGVVDIQTSILLERQNMFAYGLVMINTIYDKEKNLFSQPAIQTMGLISSDHERTTDIEKMISKTVTDEIQKNLGLAKSNSVSIKLLKINLKKSVMRMIERQLQKKPMILVTISQLSDYRQKK